MTSKKTMHVFGVKGFFSASVAAVPLMLAASPAFAQDIPPSETPLSETPPSDSQTQEGEILVTAQRREQRLIDVPAAITAISGEEVRQLNLSTFTAVTNGVPNFYVDTARGANTTPGFVIRGVTEEASGRLNDSSVAIYTDEVFVGDATQLTGSLFDVERVEVLRGPQGTLFGRNTTAGLVHFISAAPTSELSGHGSVLVGQDNMVTLEGAVSGPLSDRVRVRVAGKWDRHDGHYFNQHVLAGTNGIERRVGDRNIWGVRGIVDVDLTEADTLRLIVGRTENQSQATPGRTLGALRPGATAPFDRETELCSLDQILAGRCISTTQTVEGGAPVVGRKAGLAITNLTPYDLRVRGESTFGTLKWVHDFDWATLSYIASYSDSSYLQSADGDAGSTPSDCCLNVVQVSANQSETFSQELRLNGSLDSFDWVGGLYFYKDSKDSHIETQIRSSGVSQIADVGVDTDSFALFGQLDNRLSSEVTLSLGARYTIENRRLDHASARLVSYPSGAAVTVPQDIRAAMIANGLSVVSRTRDFIGRIALTWEPSSTQTYYASYSRGTKSPGFNGSPSPSLTPLQNAAIIGPVGREVLDSFEVGAKNRFFGNLLSLDSAVFLYNFDGKQETLQVWDGNSARSNYINVGAARMYGAETEISIRPSSRFDFKLGAGLIHSEITRSSVIIVNSFGQPVPLQGKRLQRVPDWNGRVIGAYHLPLGDAGKLTFQTEVTGRDDFFFSIQNDPLVTAGGDLFLTNFRLLWESLDGKYNAQAFVTNAFNEASIARAFDVALGNSGKFNMSEGEGRVWGVKFGMEF